MGLVLACTCTVLYIQDHLSIFNVLARNKLYLFQASYSQSRRAHAYLNEPSFGFLGVFL